MEGFTKMVKMQHFKEGGKVNVMHKGGTTKVMCAGGKYKEGGLADVKQDEKTAKKVVKSAFGMHDNQLHDGEKTDLSKLRKGGRAKKEGGNVRKYKAAPTKEEAKAAVAEVFGEKVSPETVQAKEFEKFFNEGQVKA